MQQYFIKRGKEFLSLNVNSMEAAEDVVREIYVDMGDVEIVMHEYKLHTIEGKVINTNSY
jgi:hypothetical protein